MIKPTVGRKVWYRPSHQDLSTGTESTPPMTVSGEQPLDATVVAVWGDRCVNLVIFDIYGNKYERRSVTLKQEGDTIAEGQAYAEWMPYQAGQAKKNESIGTASTGTSSTLPPHQQRVMDEHTELADKACKLFGFFETAIYKALPAEEQSRLSKQYDAMMVYAGILIDRIAAF